MEQIQALTEALMDRLFVEIEASGRHVHLTREQVQTLFGHPLTPARELSQPGQYLAEERVTVAGPRGKFENVAVLGPPRREGQVEISLTDGRTLGIRPPVRLSGDVADTPGVEIIGPVGRITLPRGVLAAKRHVHLRPEDAENFHVRDGQCIRLQACTDRPVIFADVVVRVSPEFAPRVHLDTDEANACGLRPGDLGRILP